MRVEGNLLFGWRASKPLDGRLVRSVGMHRYCMVWRLDKPTWRDEVGVFNALLGYRRMQVMNKTTVGRKPKKKVYHRVHELDRVMELQKKSSMVLRLISVIQSQKSECLLLRDLEKYIGFVEKWNYISAIEKYTSIFRVVGGQMDRSPPAVTFTEKAKNVLKLEFDARIQMEPILVRNIRKLLMLSIDCRLPLETIELIGNELGLPGDFKKTLILKHPQFFRVDELNGREYLHLENWDSSLAVTSREERVTASQMQSKKVSRDGNFPGPFAFRLNFPVGFRPNTSYLEEVRRWQKLEFPSPYLNARRFEISDPKARKRAVAVLHELLSLTMEKKLTSTQLDAFHSECRLPARLLLCLIKHHGIFYLTNKGVFSTVILKEAYKGSSLIDKCPLLEFRDRVLALMGRNEGNALSASPSGSGIIT